MARDARRGDLLYVADNGTNEVDVYSYPRGNVEGVLTGFSSPSGLCADAAGDVFVPDTLESTIYEYAHGGTSPIATLTDESHSFPDGCAIDPSSGDLAVMNLGQPPDGVRRGDIAVFAHARGTPRIIHRAIYHPYSGGYDVQGNLFVDGESRNFSEFRFGEIPRGRSRFVPIALDTPVQLAGGVERDGNAVAVGDVYRNVIYRFAISGSTGNRIGTAQLTEGGANWQFELSGGRVIVTNARSYATSSALFYRYPDGGDPTKNISSGLEYPVGVALSRRR